MRRPIVCSDQGMTGMRGKEWEPFFFCPITSLSRPIKPPAETASNRGWTTAIIVPKWASKCRVEEHWLLKPPRLGLLSVAPPTVIITVTDNSAQAVTLIFSPSVWLPFLCPRGSTSQMNWWDGSICCYDGWCFKYWTSRPPVPTISQFLPACQKNSNLGDNLSRLASFHIQKLFASRLHPEFYFGLTEYQFCRHSAFMFSAVTRRAAGPQMNSPA